MAPRWAGLRVVESLATDGATTPPGSRVSEMKRVFITGLAVAAAIAAAAVAAANREPSTPDAPDGAWELADGAHR